jgi:DNA helicase-4
MLTSFQSDWDKWLRNNERYSAAQLDQLRSLLPEESIDGRSVKSKGEKRIADFFFEHNIDYQYEYPWRTDRGVVIYPDFYLPQYRVVSEFLGLNGDKDYDEAAAFKRRYWEGKPGYKLVEIYPKDLDGLSPDFVDGREQDYATLQTRIKEALLEQGCGDIELPRLTDEEILEKLKKRIRLEFEKLLSTVLTRLGQRCQSNADVMSLVSGFKASNEAEHQFIQLLPIIDEAYRELLKRNHATDFAQLKWDCIKLLKQGHQSFEVERGKVRVFPERLRYIFIDEFQDFSDLYQEIIQALLLHSNDGVVNAVGDDWQMINRFAGSDLSLFHGFSETFPRPRELTLTTNFRSCPEIVDFCNAVMAGQGAPARSADHLQNKVGRVAQVCLNTLQLNNAEEHYFRSDPTISSLLRLIPSCSRGLKLEEQIAVAKSTDQGIEGLKPFFYILTRTNFPQGLKVGADHFSFIKSKSGRGLKFLDEFLTSTQKNDLYPSAVRTLRKP